MSLEIETTKSYAAYCKFCIIHNIDTTDERLVLTIRALLTKMSDDDLEKEINKMAFETNFFPSVADVMKRVTPDRAVVKDEGMIMAKEIFEICARYHSQDALNAKAELGEKRWFIVTRFGGLEQIHNLKYSEMPIATAQMRDLCGAYMNRDISPEKHNQISGGASGLKSLGNGLNELVKIT